MKNGNKQPIKTFAIKESVHRLAKNYCHESNQKIGGYIENLIIHDYKLRKINTALKQ
jgi:hypothetical protein